MPEGGRGGIIPLSGGGFGREVTEEVKLAALHSRVGLTIQIHTGTRGMEDGGLGTRLRGRGPKSCF